jgi:L-fuconolactonase
MPKFPIVDSHVHLYDPAVLPYSWMKNRPKLNRRYDLSDFDRARGPVEVEKIVFAEVWTDMWGGHVEEAKWVAALAREDKRLAGIVAAAPVEHGSRVAKDLEALTAIPGVVGIRRLIEVEADGGFCLEPGFIEGVRLLPKFGLSFDICVKHWQFVFALELARRCPEVTFILDHIGKPGIRHGLWEPWKSQMREMARLPNVFCKVSGVITEADHAHWTKEEVKPYVAHTIECFGFDRSMYGSDWTVSELTHEYPAWVAILDEVVAGASAEEQRKLWHDNAIRIYRLPK